MKKIFLFFAAMLVAVAVNAATTEVSSGSKTLSAAITAATSGDTLLLVSTGDYTESSSYEITKNITIIADAGKTPVIKARKFYVSKGARVEFQNVKFDASAAVSDHQITSNDATAGNKLILNGCDFYDFALNSSLIHCGGSEKLDSCIVNNCTFKNIKKSCLFFEQSSMAGLIVTNSTFANIITETGSYYASIINPFASDVKVKIDNCTFYDCNGMASDHGAIRVPSSTDVTVSNCIFMMPSSYAGRAVMIKGGYVKNCLLKNFTKGVHGIHTDSPWAPTITDCIYEEDPLFADASNGDFSLPDSSPVKGKGIGGTHLGDPRWWYSTWKAAAVVEVDGIVLDQSAISIEIDEVELLTATVSPSDATDPSVSWTSDKPAIATVTNGLVNGVSEGKAIITAKAGNITTTCEVTVSAATIPSVDFAESLVLSGKKAKIEGNVWKNEAYKLYWSNKSENGTATWNIHVNNPCVVSGVLNAVEGGHHYVVELYEADEIERLDYMAHSKSKAWPGAIDQAMDSVGHTTLTFPKAGDYRIVLANEQQWSSGKCAGITLTKVTDLMDIYLKADQWDVAGAKFGIQYTDNDEYYPSFLAAVDGTEHLYVARLFPVNKKDLKIIRFNKDNTEPSDEGQWNSATTTRGDGKDAFVVTGWDDSGWWSECHPEIAEDGFYLVGTHNAWKPSNEDIFTYLNDAPEYSLTKNVAEGDKFKAMQITDKVRAGWYPDGSDNEYTIPSELAGNVTIYFRPNGKDEWYTTNGGDKKFYVQYNGSSTAVENTTVQNGVVKMIENGQIVIVKGNVRYNVLGNVIR